MIVLFFFFKQKTAYEMRISDWSSDVCSSDLMAGKKLSVEDRQDIVDLFAQYCHRVDHADGEGWAALFTSDGAFDIKGITRLEGTEQLRGMPAVVSEQGNGTDRKSVV